MWSVAVPGLGIDLLARMGAATQVVGPAQVGVTVIAAGLAGLVTSVVLARITRRPLRVWAGVSTAVGVLSLAGPLIGAVSVPAMITLVLMQVVVAGILIIGLAPTRDPADRS